MASDVNPSNDQSAPPPAAGGPPPATDPSVSGATPSPPPDPAASAAPPPPATVVPVAVVEDQSELASARARQIKLQDTTNATLAYVVTAMFAGVLIALIFFGARIESAAKDILFTLLGVLGTGWANIVGYYFGSSAGSQQKSQTISAALTQKQGDAS